MKMKIKKFLIEAEIEWAKVRLKGLIKYGALGVMISRQHEIIAELENGIFKVDGDCTLLEKEFESYEPKKGKGGKTYIEFDNKIKYYSQDKYGRYISI